MAQIDFRERQLTLKLVYYGPPLSGKTTNLTALHARVDELNRGRLMTLDTRDDRTLFFDLLPIIFKTSKLSFRVKVYTVPGQPLHEATRRVVLRGADGVAFVADSRYSQLAANEASYADMLDNLDIVGLDPGTTPIVVQYNKRDLGEVMTDAEIDDRAAKLDVPVYRAAALRGEGVVDTFFGLLDRTWEALDRRFDLRGGFGLVQADFLSAMRAHIGIPGQ